MIVLESTFPELEVDYKTIELLGIGLVSISEKTHNIIFRKGIGVSQLKILIKIYKKEIIKKKEGKLVDLRGRYTVYVHFYETKNDVVTLFYINENNKLINYDKLCLISNYVFNLYNENAPNSAINLICNKIIPKIEGISALFIISTCGHCFYKRINKEKKFLAENYIQVGGFISAILAFSKEVLCHESEETLQTINFENQQFEMQVKNDVIFAYLIDNKNDSENVKRYIDLIVEEFFERYSSIIVKFNGDLNPFDEFEKVIDKYFVI
ncbi:MAG: hypothetical protein ACFE85_08100 [Candidatus Hodarchaeota archaeon]